MGEQDAARAADERQQRAFMKALLDDLRALELMLEGDVMESGVRRIGSEQEMFLVDSGLGPAPGAAEVLARVSDEGGACGADVLLGGILPTLALSDLSMENITPRPRYHELNRVIGELRGGTFSAYIKGRDELHIKHENILLVSCRGSF